MKFGRKHFKSKTMLTAIEMPTMCSKFPFLINFLNACGFRASARLSQNEGLLEYNMCELLTQKAILLGGKQSRGRDAEDF